MYVNSDMMKIQKDHMRNVLVRALSLHKFIIKI